MPSERNALSCARATGVDDSDFNFTSFLDRFYMSRPGHTHTNKSNPRRATLHAAHAHATRRAVMSSCMPHAICRHLLLLSSGGGMRMRTQAPPTHGAHVHISPSTHPAPRAQVACLRAHAHRAACRAARPMCAALPRRAHTRAQKPRACAGLMLVATIQGSHPNRILVRVFQVFLQAWCRVCLSAE